MATNYWARYRRRIGRRGFLAGAGAGVAGAAFLAACGGDDSDSSDSTGTAATGAAGTGPGGSGASTGAPGATGIVAPRVDTSGSARRGGAVKGALSGEPSTLDPMSFDTPLMNPIKNIVYSMLLREKEGTIEQPQEYNELVPNIAESWEYSPDRLTVTMKIRQGVKFHNKPPLDGREMTIDDVVFSWDRYAEVGNYRATLSNGTNPNAPIESFVAMDDSTLQIRLANPAANALNLLAHPYHGRYVVMARESDGGYEPRGEMIGTGPFVLTSYESSVGMEFQRNPDYWDANQPYVDTVSAPFVPDYAQIVAQFKTGALYAGGAGYVGLSPNDTMAVKQEVPEIQLYAYDPFSLNTSALRFGWLPAGESPFRDERVRQAFSMAIDRDLFLQTFGGGDVFPAAGIPIEYFWSSSVLPGGFWWTDPRDADFGENGKYYQYNVEEAKSLLSAAGYANGLDVPAHRVQGGQYGPLYHPQSDVFEQMLSDVGFNSQPDLQDFTTVYVPEWLQGNGKYDGYVHTRAPATGNDVISIFSDLYWSKSGVFFFGFDKDGKGNASGDPDIDAQIEKLRVEFDADAQLTIAQSLQRSLAKSMYGVMLPGSNTIVRAAWPVLSNYLTKTWTWGQSGSDYLDVFNWWIDESKAPLA